MTIVALEADRHAALRLDPLPGGAGLRFARLGRSEIPLAVADFPLCFAKDETTGRFDLIALLSLAEPRNLFWDNGHWASTYVPEAVIAAPFRLASSAPLGLSIDRTDPRLGASGDALFDEAGQPSDMVARSRDRLEQLIADVGDAREMAARFAAHALIRPLTLIATHADGADHAVEGLYSLDPEALHALGDETVVDLYRRGDLSAASLISASLAQVERLRQRHNASASLPIERIVTELG